MLMRKLIRKPDVVSGIFFLLFGLGIVGFSSIIEVGSFDNPGPGLFPLLSGIVLTCLSLILVIRSFELAEEAIFNLSKDGYARVFSLPGAMILYAILIDSLGFIIATSFLLFYFLKLVSNYSYKRSILYALLISVSTYVIFNIFLDVGLPSGLMNMFGQ